MRDRHVRDLRANGIYFAYHFLKEKLQPTTDGIGRLEVDHRGELVTMALHTREFFGHIGSVGEESDFVFEPPRIQRPLGIAEQFLDSGAQPLLVGRDEFGKPRANRFDLAPYEFDSLVYVDMIAEFNDSFPSIAFDIWDMNYPPHSRLPVPGGGLALDSITVTDAILDCDVLIPVSVMKCHELARVTLTHKQYIGTAATTVYGTATNNKILLPHWQGQPGGNPALTELEKVIIDLFSFHPADFAVWIDTVANEFKLSGQNIVTAHFFPEEMKVIVFEPHVLTGTAERIGLSVSVIMDIPINIDYTDIAVIFEITYI